MREDESDDIVGRYNAERAEAKRRHASIDTMITDEYKQAYDENKEAVAECKRLFEERMAELREEKRKNYDRYIKLIELEKRRYHKVKKEIHEKYKMDKYVDGRL